MLELESEVMADAFEVSLELSRAREGGLNVRHHVFGAHMVQKVRLRHEPSRLFARAAEQERFAHAAKTVRELFEGVDAGCIERGHIAKAQDDDGG